MTHDPQMVDIVFDQVARACSEAITVECGECSGSLAAFVAKAVLEASHHAELAEALRGARDMLIEYVGDEARGSIEDYGTLLAKLGGEA